MQNLVGYPVIIQCHFMYPLSKNRKLSELQSNTGNKLARTADILFIFGEEETCEEICSLSSFIVMLARNCASYYRLSSACPAAQPKDTFVPSHPSIHALIWFKILTRVFWRQRRSSFPKALNSALVE